MLSGGLMPGYVAEFVSRPKPRVFKCFTPEEFAELQRQRAELDAYWYSLMDEKRRRDELEQQSESLSEQEQRAYDDGWHLGQMGHIDPLDTYLDSPDLRAAFLRGLRNGIRNCEERNTEPLGDEEG
jgi:hypothetical protein